ncbi:MULTISPECIES: hypothetical protein [Micromonospora]|uniref:TrbC/VIRB2 family protein n=1 Tax=Micromonospora yangpuensis TaxID=683228 RepID=A0A1C6V481_9ACTN|nr:hypothetical protein [Micromonospora yangpuensis]GGM14733.1 hypothetical protein GCM10012279_36110 [Micromonospora yangpuensis]SCL60720.1 hypothetical protein GA0070617_4457 [Micromonospora yangpuensis]
MLTHLLDALVVRVIVAFPAVAVPQPGSKAPPGKLSTLVKDLLGLLAWAGTAAGVAGVLITGTMMAVSMKRGESSEHLSRLGLVLCGCILIATAGPLVSWFFGTSGSSSSSGSN